MAVLWYGACSPKPVPAPVPAETGPPPDGISASSRLSPQALLRPGENPLWFELRRDGPRLIGSPGEASLAPFAPWPQARLVTGFLPQEDRLIGAVNQSGFLIFIPGPPGDVALYSVTDVPDWEPYTVASLFLYRETPAVLLYRNDFFADPHAPLPDPPVRGLVRDSPRPMALDLPILGNLSRDDGWEVDALRPGRDGYWYYRGRKRGGDKPEIAYFRGQDLSGPGEPASAGAFRAASAPAPLKEAPVLLGRILEEAFGLSGPGTIPVAAVSSAAFGGSHSFSAAPFQAAEEGELVELTGFYRAAGERGPSAASYGLAVFPGGKGIYGTLREGVVTTGPFTLPPLPEKFSYTGIALSGSALIALWEEREGAHIGAAGFMVMLAPLH
jgi:hypothetical protein